MLHKNKLLIADNDDITMKKIIPHLKSEGFSIVHKSSVEDSYAILIANSPHLVLFDIMIGGSSGFDLCCGLREKFKGPIMVLASKNDDMDHILSLTLGADDYIPKDIDMKVLVARIKALLRRSYQGGTDEDKDILTIGELNIDARRREVFFYHKPVGLTTFEFDLLHFFAIHAGTVISRDAIYRNFYNSMHNGVCRSIDMYISRIRKKLGEDPLRPKLLKTVRGAGYLLMDGSVTTYDKSST